MSKISVFIAQSLDGYIADSKGNLSFLEPYEKDDNGYFDFYSKIDTVVMGRKTYEKVLSFGVEWPYKDKEFYLISNSIQKLSDPLIVSNNPKELIEKLKKENKNVYVDGGELINFLVECQLIDEFIITTVPFLLGKGSIKLFNNQNSLKLKFVSSKVFQNGLVQTHYLRE